MLIKCNYCELAFRDKFYLKQHLIHNYKCSYKHNKVLLQINDTQYNYNYNYDDNFDDNINKNKIIDKPHQTKITRLENRIELNKIQSNTITLPENVDTNINVICNESARRLSEILKN